MVARNVSSAHRHKHLYRPGSDKVFRKRAVVYGNLTCNESRLKQLHTNTIRTIILYKFHMIKHDDPEIMGKTSELLFGYSDTFPRQDSILKH
jgi:hypothetical protein